MNDFENVPAEEELTCRRIIGEGKHCGAPLFKMAGKSPYCVKHFRFHRMRAEAKHQGKTVPTEEQLEWMIPPDMRCPHCLEEMIWSAPKGRPRDRIMCLQHYNDGALGLICMSCNIIHGQVADVTGDYDFLPKGKRFCRRCEQFKPMDEFYPMKYGCRDCVRAKNRVRTREWRAKKRQEAV